MTLEQFLSDPFHACALAAFVEQSIIEQGWPDSDRTHRLAIKYYEQVKNG